MNIREAPRLPFFHAGPRDWPSTADLFGYGSVVAEPGSFCMVLPGPAHKSERCFRNTALRPKTSARESHPLALIGASRTPFRRPLCCLEGLLVLRASCAASTPVSYFVRKRTPPVLVCGGLRRGGDNLFEMCSTRLES